MSEISLNFKSARRLASYFKQSIFYTLLGVIVVAIGIYFGDVLFGERSFEVLRDLQSEKISLYKDVKELKIENSRLQKEYFELKVLEPESK